MWHEKRLVSASYVFEVSCKIEWVVGYLFSRNGGALGDDVIIYRVYNDICRGIVQTQTQPFVVLRRDVLVHGFM